MSRNVRIFSALLVLVLCLPALALGLPAGIAWGAGTSQPRVVMIILDKVTWSELGSAKPLHLTALAKRGAVGILSNRTAEPRTTSGGGYMTIGTGTRSFGPAPGARLDTSVVAKLKRVNAGSYYKARVGALADSLREAGKSTVVLGNADAYTPNGRRYYGREAELIGIDDRARLGDDKFERLLGADSQTDYRALLKRVDSALAGSDLIVVETGDTRRADVAGAKMRSAERSALKGRALRNADAFIGAVAARLNENGDLLMVVSPSPPDREGPLKDSLTPLILVDNKYKAGLLTSGSTRRIGLVTNMDIAPTVAAHLDVDWREPTPGHVLKSVPGAVSLGRLARMVREYEMTERLSVPVIFIYSGLVGVAALLGMTILVFPNIAGGFFIAASRFFLLAALGFPLATFIVPLVPFSLAGETRYLLGIVILTLLISVFAWRFRRDGAMPVLVLTAATSLFILANLLAGAPGDLNSTFGYTVVTAARFYGIGNHYLSFLLGAVLMSTMLWIDRTKAAKDQALLTLLIMYIAIVLMLGLGSLGANTGGILMAAPTLTLAYLRLRKGRFSAWQVITGLFAGASALVVLALADAWWPAEPAHLGAAARQVYATGGDIFGTIVARKIEANLSVLNHPLSSAYTPIVALIFATVVFALSRGRRWDNIGHYPGAGLALVVGGAGGVLGSLVNDSGVAVAALTIAYLLNAVIFLELSSMKERGARISRNTMT